MRANTVCRYSDPDYKTHWACLPCRFTAKHPRRVSDPLTGELVTPRCPHCSEPMLDMGRDFAAPRRADRRGWRKLAILVARGQRFDSCGCVGPGPRPRTLGEAVNPLLDVVTTGRFWGMNRGPWRGSAADQPAGDLPSRALPRKQGTARADRRRRLALGGDVAAGVFSR